MILFQVIFCSAIIRFLRKGTNLFFTKKDEEAEIAEGTADGGDAKEEFSSGKTGGSTKKRKGKKTPKA